MKSSPQQQNFEKQYSSHWDKAKDALRRDWEQTKQRVSSSGKELDQSVGDTVKQMAGASAPNANRPNAKTESGWQRMEPAVRFGYTAHLAKAGADEEQKRWNSGIEDELKQEWKADHEEPWNESVRDSVVEGWNFATEQLKNKEHNAEARR